MNDVRSPGKSKIDRLDDLLKKAGLDYFVNNKVHKKRTKRRRDSDDENGNALSHTYYTASPPFIIGEMRDYQINGLNWLISLHTKNVNGILADEMGLGKTIQTISLLGYLKHIRKISGPHLVIVPKSTLNNWITEMKRFCPTLKPVLLIGTKLERNDIIENKIKKNNWDVIVTSYEMILKEKIIIKKYCWDVIVVDEAHRIKNENTIISQLLRTLYSKHRLLLTGTPLQNNLHELWSLLNFLMPNVFNDSNHFDEWFDTDKCLDEDQNIVTRLHAVLKPFVLRRIKSEVEKSLIPKKETKILIGLSKMQKKWYQKILMNNLDYINAQGKTETKQLRNILIELRKCSNHPYLLQGAEPGPSYTTEEHIVKNCGKMIILDKLLAKLKEQGSKVLLFSQFKMMLDIIEDYLDWRGYKHCRLDGETSLDDRTSQMKDFNSPDSDKFIFIISTHAGGLGISLVAADTVIIYDSDWNPQNDLQAIDRAHRIGQEKQVCVFRIVTENSIDEKIVERAEIKRRLDRIVIQQGRLNEPNSKSIDPPNVKSMIQYGMKYILSSNDSDIKDEDIDEILSRGERTTASENAMLDKLDENGLKAFESINVYDFEGVNYRQKRKSK